jgi:hypothetical protein
MSKHPEVLWAQRSSETDKEKVRIAASIRLEFYLTLFSYVSSTRLRSMSYMSRSTFRILSNHRSSTTSRQQDSHSRHRRGMLLCLPFRSAPFICLLYHLQSRRTVLLRVHHRLVQGNNTRGTFSITNLSAWANILYPSLLGIWKPSYISLPRPQSS